MLNQYKKNMTTHFSDKSDEISTYVKIISLYLKRDCKKLSRINNYNTNEKLIKLNNLCTYIINKYPTPDLTGFPFDYWTPYRMQKYISFFFNVKINVIHKKTVSNILNNKITQQSMPITSNENRSERYYLYIKYDKLKKIKNNGVRQYNRHIFAMLINLNDLKYTKLSRVYYYDKNKKRPFFYIPNLYDILKQLLRNVDGSNTTIYIKSNYLKNFKIRSFRSLSFIPEYRFIIFNNIQKISSEKKLLQNMVEKNVLNTDIETFKSIYKAEQELKDIHLKVRSKKKDFLDNIKKIFENVGIKN